MNKYRIIKIGTNQNIYIDVAEMIDVAASWFHEKWGVPKEAYVESMEESLAHEKQICGTSFAKTDEPHAQKTMGVDNTKEQKCMREACAVPQWYIVLDGDKIIAGLGVIENDFHDRKDLTPNVCAVYVEEAYRKQGVAGEMLNYVCKDMQGYGIDTLYLLTDHTSFYERYDWEFYCMAQGDGEEEMARMYVHKMMSK